MDIQDNAMVERSENLMPLDAGDVRKDFYRY